MIYVLKVVSQFYAKNICEYFNENCHECLMETASHKLEHNNIDFKTNNSVVKEKEKIKELKKYR